MIEINGITAGGQLIRTALSLSSITLKPFKMTNVRSKRDSPGLKAQHLAALNAIQKLCNAKISGASLKSTEVSFSPNKASIDNIKVDIGTAGSTTLLLQTLIPPCLFKKTPTKIEVIGGTDTHWALPSLYFKEIFCYFLEKIGAKIDFEVKKYGFYPKGQGDVVLKITPCKKLTPLHIKDRGELKRVTVSSYASKNLEDKKFAEASLQGFAKNFPDKFNSDIHYVSTASNSCFVHATVHYDNTRLGHTAILHKNEDPSTAGERCAKTLLEEINSKATIDRFAADQLMLYLALAGSGSYTTSKIRNHISTNASVIEKFLPVKFIIKENHIKCIAKDD